MARTLIQLTLVSAVSALASAALAACGVDAPPDPVPPTPALHFLVDDRPQDPDSVAVEATEARYGDPFVVVADGLTPGDRVAIEGRMYGLASHASFTVPGDGKIDLSRDAPDADPDNTWSGVDAEGLVWSMLDETPPPATLDLTVTVTVKNADGGVIVEGALARRTIDDGLDVTNVQSGRTTGALAVPPGDGPFPAVLVFGGSEGGTGTGIFNALYLGSLGYAALGVGYFGATGVPATLDEVPLEILEEDLAFLAADPRVDPDRIAVMGASRGGELALLLGAHFPVVKAVIADVPSGVIWPGDSFPDLRSAWSLDGTPLPFMPDVGADPDVTVDGDGVQHVVSRPIFEADLAAASPEALAAATTHVEDTGGPILLLAGDADALWPSCTLADIAWQRLQADHVTRFADETHCFADAGHLIGIPGWSTNTPQEFFEQSFNAYLVTGGTAAGMGKADRDADTAIRGFLEHNL